MNTTTKLLALLIATAPATVFARPCPTIAEMAGPVGAIESTWLGRKVVPSCVDTDQQVCARVPNTGIQTLFDRNGACMNCHSAHPVNPKPYAGRFATCATCHTANNEFGTNYPNWLDFTTREALMKASYYVPGKTKAEASLIRSIDGTMPPGANPHHPTERYTGELVGWCQEIQDKFSTWIANGYPQ